MIREISQVRFLTKTVTTCHDFLMNKKPKSGYIWVIIILNAIGIFFSLGTTTQLTLGLIDAARLGVAPENIELVLLAKLSLVLYVADLILAVLFWIKLHKLDKKILTWINVYLGWSFVFSAITEYFAQRISPAEPGVLFSFLFFMAVILVIWITFYRHVKKFLATPATVQTTETPAAPAQPVV